MSENCDRPPLDPTEKVVTTPITNACDDVALLCGNRIWRPREARSSALTGEMPQIRIPCSEGTYKVVLSGSIESCFNSSS
jgi:hypothetical protein